MLLDFGDKKSIKERMIKLRGEIADLRYRYHVENAPDVTDEVYDSLNRELSGLEEKYPEFADPNSSIHRVAGKPLDAFKKVRHRRIIESHGHRGNPLVQRDEIFHQQ